MHIQKGYVFGLYLDCMRLIQVALQYASPPPPPPSNAPYGTRMLELQGAEKHELERVHVLGVRHKSGPLRIW